MASGMSCGWFVLGLWGFEIFFFLSSSFLLNSFVYYAALPLTQCNYSVTWFIVWSIHSSTGQLSMWIEMTTWNNSN